MQANLTAMIISTISISLSLKKKKSSLYFTQWWGPIRFVLDRFPRVDISFPSDPIHILKVDRFPIHIRSKSSWFEFYILLSSIFKCLSFHIQQILNININKFILYKIIGSKIKAFLSSLSVAYNLQACELGLLVHEIYMK